MTNYEHAKEYYEFYNEYKQSIFTGGSEKTIDYRNFAEKNEDSYKIFEKNLKRINEANALLQKQNNTLKLGLNKYADVVDFDNDYAHDLMINTISKNDISPTTYFKFLQTPLPYIDGVFNKDKLRDYSWNDTGLLSPVKKGQWILLGIFSDNILRNLHASEELFQ